MLIGTARIVGSEIRRQQLWQKAQSFAADLVSFTAKLPRNPTTDVISTQLVRSGASIAANIAEGYGRYSQPAYRNHLSIARGSAFETESWLDLLSRCGHLSAANGPTLMAKCTELEKLLTLRMKSLSSGKTYAVKEEARPYEAL